jgi:leucine dehydrogenase
MSMAAEVGGAAVPADAVLATPCDVLSPCALGAILDENSIPVLDCAVVAGGANNQLARAGHGGLLAERGILYAPDYVINAGGIIDVALEYLGRRAGKPHTAADVNARIEQIPQRLVAIWHESEASGVSPDVVADRMAQELIGRG